MSRSLSKFLQIAVPLGLGIFLIWYIYQSFTPQQLTETKKHFTDANYGFVLLSIALSVLSHISRSYRWSFMLEPLGYRTKIANNFMAVSVAYLMNIFIPKSGEFSRGIILDKYEGVPFQKGFGTIISERIVDLIFLLLFTALALFIKFDVLYQYIVGSIPSSLLYILIFGIVLGAISIPLYVKFSKSNVNKKLKNFVIGLKEGIFSILKMQRKAAFLFHSFLIWGLYLLSFYTALHALPETANISIGTIIIAFVVGSFTFAFTNSGFGTYPAAIAGILAIFGVAKTVGVAVGWIVWISNISAIIFFGVLSLVLLPIYNRKGLQL
ncbi:lysylphosphatidylglycerol synthase transmembrane domain-containing protein [Aequorivita marisscotiae]|uniref:Lysylphosphatidylglycerol synthase transmembrane domain-containing protein n=1 Tax=Aequorivita marisscotiae TaxID=3040348 RepID=A0ABY8KYI2_9FLAO|nr:lysylphosphatidylglycerol synthase transmembrane domain-containing protein [Aequorivita sp. Ant34-E75]WGF93280.1 lysylphosphatidylglycerol synthase transmembrane domain-containing protein [Aequorivita sp. Ant34-E75]